MDRTGVRFDKDACDLFGQRIMMRPSPRAPFVPAVIKSWSPCARAAFGVVFDHAPDKVMEEDLLRKGRNDWKVVDWDGDIWETMETRPSCPSCGHPLGIGREAWTRCTACGEMEPGCSAHGMLSRTRTARCDPYRAHAVSYVEGDESDEDAS